MGSGHGGASPSEIKLEDVGIWNAALTVDEMTSYSNKVPANRIRPQSLLNNPRFIDLENRDYSSLNAKYTRQASDGLRQAREALTLLALSGLPDQNTGGFSPSGVDIPDPTTDTAGGYPAALNNAKVFYEERFSQYWEDTRLTKKYATLLGQKGEMAVLRGLLNPGN